MDSKNRHSVKLFAAVIGGSALVAVGAMSAAIAQQSAGADMTATGATVGAITPSAPAPGGAVQGSVAKAVPEVKASQTYGPGEEPNNMPVS